MLYLLFIVYLAFFCWLITRVKFFTNSGLSSKVLVSLFLIRISMSLLTCYINLYYLPVSDSVAFHNGGIDEYHLLFSDPATWVISIFQDSHQNGYAGFLEVTNSYWNDTRSTLIYKMLSIFDIFSGKNFYINTLLYNFLVFFAPVALYRVFSRIFPGLFYPLIIVIFLLPSALFYTSAIHRDGLILLSISMIIYYLYFWMIDQKFSWKRVIAILLFMALIVIVRNYVFIALVPALLAWIIARNKPKYSFLIFAGIYTAGAVLFFCSGYFSTKTNLPQYVVERQSAFIEVSKLGNSTINITPLHPNFTSFVANAPEALDHSLLRPYLTEIKSIAYLPFALENIIYGALIVLFIFFRKKAVRIDPLIYCCIFFCITIFLITGYTVPIIGAVVRYRSIYLIFLMLPVVCYTDWRKLAAFFKIKIKNIYCFLS